MSFWDKLAVAVSERLITGLLGAVFRKSGKQPPADPTEDAKKRQRREAVAGAARHAASRRAGK